MAAMTAMVVLLVLPFMAAAAADLQGPSLLDSMMSEEASGSLRGVPSSLRNMLLYAQHLADGGGSERDGVVVSGGVRTHQHQQQDGGRKLLAPGDDTGMGCGFYDVFYEGCMPCFYGPAACVPSGTFYDEFADFYQGEVRESSTTTYEDSFTDPTGFAFGDRSASSLSPVYWSRRTPAVTPSGEPYLGHVPAHTHLDMGVTQLPSSPAQVKLSFELVVVGGVSSVTDVVVELLGEEGGMAVLVAESKEYVSRHVLGTPSYRYEYWFNHTGSNMRVRFTAVEMDEDATWGLDNVSLRTLVENNAPEVMDRDIHTLPDQPATIELRGFDEECDNLDFVITSLPTEGRLFFCDCESIWSEALTPNMLPAVVPGPCQRVVYAPRADSPSVTTNSVPFDTFTYKAIDSLSLSSPAGWIRIYVEADNTPTPVAGVEGYALAFDGIDDVLSIARTPATLSSYSSFTAELRFKPAGDIGESMATLMSRVGSFALRISQVGGIGFELITEVDTLSSWSFALYNDRLWHHAALTFNGTVAALYVDGELIASAESDSDTVILASDIGITVGADSNSTHAGVNSAFQGHIDEIRLWSVALSGEKVAALFNYTTTLSGTEEGLITYLPCNDNTYTSPVVYDSTPARNDGFLGLLNRDGYSDGVSTRFPAYVASTAVFGNIVETVEDTPVVITLHGGRPNGGVTFDIATLPLSGKLYQSDGMSKGRLISSSPWPIKTRYVVYEPDVGLSGAPLDIFKYQAYDGEEFSYRQGVVINVISRNSPPTLTTPVFNVYITLNTPKRINLFATDTDSPTPTFMVTRLPARGWLRQANWTGAAYVPTSDLITSVNTPVTNANGKLFYITSGDTADLGNEAYDTFGYVAVDTAGAQSNEGIVNVLFSNDDAPPALVAGEAGYALRFNGERDELNLGELPSNTTSVTYEIWFRTSALPSETRMVLMSAGPHVLQWTKAQGLVFSVGNIATIASFDTFNDGAWHHVSASATRDNISLVVDGQSIGFSRISSEVSNIGPVVLRVGADEDRVEGTFFSGVVDEVRVWSMPRNASEVASDMRTPLRNTTWGLVHYFRLNEAQGSTAWDCARSLPVSEALGFNGMASTQPEWIPSTAPINNVVHAVEEEDVVIQLAGYMSETESYPSVVVMVLPVNGTLYAAHTDTHGVRTRGDEILFAPFALSGMHVVYNSGHGYGSDYDTFTYVTSDAEGIPFWKRHFYSADDGEGEIEGDEALSYAQVVTINVQFHEAIIQVDPFEGVDDDDQHTAHITPERPIASSASYALLFDGVDDVAVFGPYAACNLTESATFALWMKTNVSCADAVTVVLSAGPYALVCSKIYGLAFVANNKTAASYTFINDDKWHFVIGAFDGMSANIAVDGVAYEEMAGITLVSSHADLITVGQGVHAGDAFNGIIDEFSIWNSVDAPSVVTNVSLNNKRTLMGNEIGLQGYWRFNSVLGSLLESEAPLPAGTLPEDMHKGVGGDVDTQPDSIASTLHVSTLVLLMENTEAKLRLVAGSVYEDVPDIKVIALPRNGRLLISPSGRTLPRNMRVPALTNITYVPDRDFSGNDSFIYVVDDGRDVSAPEKVHITVVNVNEPPIVSDIKLKADFYNPKAVMVWLKGSDADPEDDIELFITTLPVKGQLFLRKDSHTGRPAGKVTAINTLIPNSHVYYVPLLNTIDPVDAFGYLAQDRSGYRSMEGLVTIDGSDSISHPGSSRDTPLAGEAGLALSFDGVDDVARLRSLADYGILDGTISLSLWFKTSLTAGDTGMVLISAGGGTYTLSWTKIGALQFTFGTSSAVRSFLLLNDGSWHWVSCTWNGTVAELGVDSEAFYSVLADINTEAAPAVNTTSPITLGADINPDSDGGFFSGYVDELTIGSAYEPAVARYRFNEAAGGDLINEVNGMHDGYLGADNGKAEEMPTRVTSTAPISGTPLFMGDAPMIVSMQQDSVATILLPAVASESLKFLLLTLPELGYISNSRGEIITRVPHVLRSSVITYTPERHGFSTGDQPYASLMYATKSHGQRIFTSSPVSVEIRVSAPFGNTGILDITDELVVTNSTGNMLEFIGDSKAAAIINLRGMLSDLTSFTVELWFRVPSASTEALLGLGPVSLHWTNAGGLGLHLNGTTTIESGEVYNDGHWHYASVSVKKLESNVNVPVEQPGDLRLELFIDGQYVGSAIGPYVDLDTVDLLIGASLEDSWQEYGLPLSGSVDDIRVYGYTRNPADMEDRFTTPVLEDVVAYYPLDNNFTDVTGNTRARIVGAVELLASTSPAGSQSDLSQDEVVVVVWDESMPGPPMDEDSSVDDVEGANRPPNALPAGSALVFDGVDDSVDVPIQAEGLSAFTIEVWLKTSSPASEFTPIVWVASDAPFPHMHLYMSRLGLAFEVSNSLAAAVSIGRINDGMWHHVAASFDGEATYVYVDGAMTANATLDTPLTTYPMPKLRLGAVYFSPAEYYKGSMDNLRVWDYARTQEEIASDMNAALMGDEEGLLLYLPFDDVSFGGSAVVVDISSRHADGLTTGKPRYQVSTAPIDVYKVVTQEETYANITLFASDADESDTLMYEITSLPAGQLYESDTGNQIVVTPMRLASPHVYFIGEPLESGAPYTSFTYVAYDDQEWSQQATVSINVTPAIHLVKPLPVKLVQASSDAPVMISLQAFDIDLTNVDFNDSVSFIITTAPKMGHMWQTYDGVSCEAQDVLAAGMSIVFVVIDGVDTASAAVCYAPISSFKPASSSYVDTFGFTAVNHVGTPGAEQLISVNVTSAGPAGPQSLGSNALAGDAAVFDGVNDVISVMDVGDLTHAVSIQAWVRSSAAASAESTIVIKPGSFALRLSSMSGVVFEVHFADENGTLTTLSCACGLECNVDANDGSWRQLTGVWDPSVATASLYIDGSLISSNVWDGFESAVQAVEGYEVLLVGGDASLMLGGDGAADQYFNGALDEIRIWDAALPVDQISSQV
eukprot:jgi/Chlat1/2678/Chrsp18S02987